MSIGCSFFDKNLQAVDAVYQFLSPALMACRCHLLSLSSAGIALLLELLDESRRDLLLGNDHALAFALRASLHVFRVIASAPAAVRTYDLSVVFDVKRLADI
jgi:hypothetical protein